MSRNLSDVATIGCAAADRKPITTPTPNTVIGCRNINGGHPFANPLFRPSLNSVSQYHTAPSRLFIQSDRRESRHRGLLPLAAAKPSTTFSLTWFQPELAGTQSAMLLASSGRQRCDHPTVHRIDRVIALSRIDLAKITDQRSVQRILYVPDYESQWVASNKHEL
jgi:hypothetical protein